MLYWCMSKHIYKSHNKSLLLYHLVFPAKYRQKIFDTNVSETLRDVCLGISERYEIHFVEIGMEDDHVHFLIQSVPVLAVTKLVTLLKRITAKEIFRRHPEVKRLLWGGNIWTSGYYVNTVGAYANEVTIQRYIAKQGSYQEIFAQQLNLNL